MTNCSFTSNSREFVDEAKFVIENVIYNHGWKQNPKLFEVRLPTNCHDTYGPSISARVERNTLNTLKDKVQTKIE